MLLIHSMVAQSPRRRQRRDRWFWPSGILKKGWGRIAFFAPSEAVARQVAEGLGELSWTMFGDFPFYQLAVHPCQPFDEVFGFLLQTAGPGGVLEGW